MKRLFVPAAVATLALLAGPADLLAQNAPPATTVGDSGWSVIIYPVFGWLPLYRVDMRVPPCETCGPCEGCGSDGASGSASSGLNGGAFAAFRIEKGRFAAFGDFNWLGLEAERERPFMTARADVTTGGLGGGVRIVSALYIEAGARRYGVDVKASILQRPEVTWKPARWAPVVGTTFRPNISKRWRVYTRLDFAGLGGNRLSAVQGIARAEWRPLRHFVLTLGYGFAYLRLDGEIQSKPIHLSQTVHGPAGGIGIPF